MQAPRRTGSYGTGSPQMSGASTLTVVNCPDQDLAKTNMVFVASGDPLAQVGYIEIANIVFSVTGDNRVAAGGLGLNSSQRKTVKVSSQDRVQVSVFRVPTVEFAAHTLQASLDFYTKRKLPPDTPQTLIDADELTAHLQTRFGRQVFALDQILIFEYQGVNYELKVSHLLVTDKAGDQVGAARAQLVPNTALLYQLPAGSNIRLIGDDVMQPPPKQLFKQSDINFEKLGIGGLDKQFEQIFRRAFASRVFPPEVVEKLGIHHVKGMLLYGPPGTGKTLIARSIGKMLNGKEPKVVNGPEVLNKFVGASEENVRKLFEDAEKDQHDNGNHSELHVIIFDEIDAICKSRGSVRDGSGVHDTVVNQLLTKIDGVDALNNILLIGMTNRKDMLDEALLRPGRLEVQVEIGLPDEKGRMQILKIHTGQMMTNSFMGKDVDLWSLAERTKNFSGAEIEGLVKSAASFALNRHVDVNDLSKQVDTSNIKVEMADFERALAEVKPAFGVTTETLQQHRLNGIIDSGQQFRDLSTTLRNLVAQGFYMRTFFAACVEWWREKCLPGVQDVPQVRTSEKTPLLTCLLEGPTGTGKTALAATVGIESEFPYVKLISAESMVGYSEQSKASQIAKIFEDAYKSAFSVIILDDIERLLEYVSIGPRFSNTILQALLVLLKRPPPQGRKLLVLGTTSNASVMEEMEVASTFNVVLHVPKLKEAEIATVLQTIHAFAPNEIDMAVASLIETQMPIKKLLLLLNMARQDVSEGTPTLLMKWQQTLREMSS